jgi:hypothetical protein
MIKLLLLLIIILFATPASADIYKFVDEQGNVRFTDDINQVPEDQRGSIEISSNYEADTEAETESEYFNDDTATDPELESSYPDEPETTEGFDDDSDNRGDVGVQEDQKEGGVSLDQPDKDQEELDLNLKGLKSLKKEIDKEYAALVKEKEELAQDQKTLTTREEILKYNVKINDLNKRADAYVKKGEQYKAQVEAYNARVIQRNAQLGQKKE